MQPHASPLLQPHASPLLGRCDQSETLTVPLEAIWMVCLTVFIDSLGGSISAPVMPFYAKDFHASSSQIGMLFSSFSLSQVIALPLLGDLSDSIGRRPVLVMSLFGAALGAWVQGVAPTLSILFLGRIISGACGAVGSTANVYICDVTDEECRPDYLGRLMSSNGLAFAFGPGLGGGLSKFGVNIPILVNSGLCLAAGVLAYVYLEETPAWKRCQQLRVKRAAEQSQPGGSYKSFSIGVWAVCGAEFLRGVSFSSIFSIFALFASEVYDLESLSIGFAVCCGALCLICTNVWISPKLDAWLGHLGCAAVGMAVIAFGELLLAYAPVLSLSLFGMCIVYVGQAIAGCTIATVTSVLATDENRGAVMSTQQMAQALGRVFGPVALATLFSINPAWPYACAAVASLLGTCILLSLKTSFRQRAASDIPLDIPSPAPAWSDEQFTDEDVEDMGLFLCELLSKGHYRWRDPETRALLKQSIALHFPPLTLEVANKAATLEEAPQNLGSINSQADPSAAGAIGNFVVRNTPSRVATRRRFGSKQPV